jgi:hypothetical protein
MEAMRQSWSDDRLDDLQLEMRNGFARLETQIQQGTEQVETRIDQLDTRIERLETRVDAGFGRLDGRIDKLAMAMFVSMMGLIATQLALVLS